MINLNNYPIYGAPEPVKPTFGQRVARFFGGAFTGALSLVPGGQIVLAGIQRARGDNSGLGAGLPLGANPSYDNLIAMQIQMQRETLQFTSLTNILKSRHEAEMSAVRNIRS